MSDDFQRRSIPDRLPPLPHTVLGSRGQEIHPYGPQGYEEFIKRPLKSNYPDKRDMRDPRLVGLPHHTEALIGRPQSVENPVDVFQLPFPGLEDIRQPPYHPWNGDGL